MKVNKKDLLKHFKGFIQDPENVSKRDINFYTSCIIYDIRNECSTFTEASETLQTIENILKDHYNL